MLGPELNPKPFGVEFMTAFIFFSVALHSASLSAREAGSILIIPTSIILSTGDKDVNVQ
jgi:hypothetical protein